MGNQQVSRLNYQGHIIADKGEMLSLTDMWKASGSDESRKPSEWLRQEATKRFIDFLGDSVAIPEVGKNHFGLVNVTRGGVSRGETFAHWQIGMAYAKYLSPEFHMWCNTQVRAVMEGKVTATGLSESDKNAIGGIVKSCAAVVLKEQIGQLLPTMLDSMVAARLAEHAYLLRRGKTAGQIWREAGFPRIRVTSWFSNRLVKMECQIDGAGRGELGLGTAKLFDPDKANNWLRNGGKVLVDQYIRERQGQKHLRLVGGKAA